MRHCIARSNLITKLAILALISLCSLPGQIHAQGMTDYIILFPSVGLATGQTLRLTLFNPAGEPMRARARVHTGGVVVGLGDGSVRSHSFHSFDFSRGDISREGEPGTGRIQLSASIVLSEVDPETSIHEFAASLEIVEEWSGSTVVAGRDLLLGGSSTDLLAGFGNDVMLGIVPGQTLRVTLSNPQPTGSNYPPSRVKLYEKGGNLIAQSPDLIIPPGEFRSFEVDRYDLVLPGERGTSRLQVRANIEALTTDQSLIAIYPRTGLIASFAIIDNSTGRTLVHQDNLK